MKLRALLLLTILIQSGFGLTQGITQTVTALHLANYTYFSLQDITKFLGARSNLTKNSFTLHQANGILVAFNNDPDLLWTPKDAASKTITLASPILKREATWFAPVELLAFLAINLSGNTLTLPDGKRAQLNFPSVVARAKTSPKTSNVPLTNGGTALAFYSTNGTGVDLLSLMIMDLNDLPFTIDKSKLQAIVKNSANSQYLYFVVTALADSNWQSEIIFRQGDQAFAARYPLNIIILEGESNTVSSEKPVSGLVTLPAYFDFRSTINVQWAGINVDFRFEQ